MDAHATSGRKDPESPLLCHRCAAVLTAGEGSFYLVRIEAFADPTPPRLDPEESLLEIAADVDWLLERAKKMSERELLDQVYRRLTLTLCTRCYQQWIENPAR